MKQIRGTILGLAGKNPAFEFTTSLKGISDLLAALFIAETRDLNLYNFYKQIEKCVGYKLRLTQSGKYSGRKRICKIGNKRLAWIFYGMIEQTYRSVPEVRIKYLKRQIQNPCHRNSLVACVPVLLKIFLRLVKEQRSYEVRDEAVAEVKRLEKIYEAKKKKQNKKAKARPVLNSTEAAKAA